MLCRHSYYDQIDYYHGDLDYTSPEVREMERVLDNTKEFVEGLTEELTGTSPIDLNAVSFYLEEIRSYLNLSSEYKPLNICRG